MDLRGDHDHDSDSEETKNLLSLNHKTRSLSLRNPRNLLNWIFSRLRLRTLRRFRLRIQLRGRRRRRCRYCPSPICYRPSRRALILCFLFFILPLSLILTILLTPLTGPSYAQLPQHYQDLAKRCKPIHPEPGCANPHKENIFIAATIHDPTGTLVSGKWGERVLSLITILGQENVYLSIYENDPGPENKGREVLNAFKQKIHSRHKVVIEGDASTGDEQQAILKDINANVTLPDGSTRIKHAAYQAELRNRVLRPLDTFNKRLGGLGGQIDIIFDKVLFLDDIAFNPIDAAHLLFNTNLQPPPTDKNPKKNKNKPGKPPKADYLLACALSYSSPTHLSPSSEYTLRDENGYPPSRLFVPFFTSSSSSSTPRTTMNNEAVIPLKSCWSGMTAIRATYLQNLSPETNTYQPVQNHILDPDSPLKNPPADDEPRSPVRFRYEPAEYYDAAPGCLFAADLAYMASLNFPSSNSKPDEGSTGTGTGVYINPYVRVASSDSVLGWLPQTMKYERLLRVVLKLVEILGTTWRRNNIPYRNIQPSQPFEEEIWDTVERKWTIISSNKPGKERIGRPGMFCGRRGMRVLDSHSDHSTPGSINKEAGIIEGLIKETERGQGRGRNWVDLKVPPGYRVFTSTETWSGTSQLEGREILGFTWKDDFERLLRDIKAGIKSVEEKERFWEVD